MRKIKKLICLMDDELESAKCYAEKYFEFKVENNSTLATRFKEMAGDELNHANHIHELVTEEIQKLKAVYTPPAEMEEAWEESHKRYVEKAAWVRQMLSM